MNKLKSKKTLALLLVIVLAALVPTILSGQIYLMLVCCYALIYLVAVSGFDVLVGFSGQMSMGHAAYFCLGAYGSALLRTYTGLPVFFTMIIATVVTTIIGSIVAWPTTRLVAHFMSLATIAFGNIVFAIVNVSPGRITGDANGYHTESISIFGFAINDYYKFYYFALVCVIIFLVFKQNILKSRAGRAMLAVRDNHQAANGMGVNIRFYRIVAFAISTFYAAYAGAMYAHLVQYISPDMFRQTLSVMFLTMLLFGGTCSVLGPAIGVAAITVLNESLRSASSYKMLIYGIVLLAIILVFPGGLMEVFEQARAWIKSRILGRKAKADGGLGGGA